MVEGLPLVPGHVFWFDSGTDTVGQEERELHPWIVVSTELFHRKTGLVLAVPCTSVVTVHAFDVGISNNAIRSLPTNGKPLSKKKPSRVAKARKVRHFSVERITEIVGIVDDPDLVIAIRQEIFAALDR